MKPWERPPRAMFNEALTIASNLEVKKWRSVWLPLEQITPSEDKEPSNELIAIMARTPWEVPPIVVEPPGVTEEFYILDGNHRYEAARQAELPGLWVLVVLEGSYA